MSTDEKKKGDRILVPEKGNKYSIVSEEEFQVSKKEQGGDKKKWE